MEANKIKGQALSIVLPNGQEVTYCERGAENKEVLITGAFYFHTVMPVVEALGKKYHVYGIVMRISGDSEFRNEDGSIHWGNTWGTEVYEFAKQMGIKKFHYFGKCHGTAPGWWLIKNHPEMLLDFCSFYMAPHLKPQNSNIWFDTQHNKGPWALMSVAMRKKTGLFKKMLELASLGSARKNMDGGALKYAFPENLWDSLEECERDVRKVNVPVYFLFGSEDVLFHDHYDSNMYAKDIVPGCKFKVLEGERHLMELDNPKQVAKEVIEYIEELDAKRG